MRTAPAAALLGAGASLLAACSILSPRPDPTRFYVLTPLTAADAGTMAEGGPALGVGPVVLPRYLERPELVTRLGPNEVRPAEFQRWAEPLRTQFERTLSQNLAVLLGTDRVVTFPWYRGVPLDFTVQVEVVRFERNQAHGAQLMARWFVKDPRGTVLHAGETQLDEPLASDDAEASVAALSRTLGVLSREVADAVRVLPHGRELKRPAT